MGARRGASVGGVSVAVELSATEATFRSLSSGEIGRHGIGELEASLLVETQRRRRDEDLRRRGDPVQAVLAHGRAGGRRRRRLRRGPACRRAGRAGPCPGSCRGDVPAHELADGAEPGGVEALLARLDGGGHRVEGPGRGGPRREKAEGEQAGAKTAQGGRWHDGGVPLLGPNEAGPVVAPDCRTGAGTLRQVVWRGFSRRLWVPWAGGQKRPRMSPFIRAPVLQAPWVGRAGMGVGWAHAEAAQGAGPP